MTNRNVITRWLAAGSLHVTSWAPDRADGQFMATQLHLIITVSHQKMKLLLENAMESDVPFAVIRFMNHAMVDELLAALEHYLNEIWPDG